MPSVTEQMEAVPIKPSHFGDYYDLGAAFPGAKVVLVQATGPSRRTHLRLLLPQQLYVRDVEALRADGYTHIAAAPVTPTWVEIPSAALPPVPSEETTGEGVTVTCRECGRTVTCPIEDGRCDIRPAEGWEIVPNANSVLCPSCAPLAEKEKNDG